MHQWDVPLRPDSCRLAHALRGLAAEARDDVRALLDEETADQTA
jgi:hypothetical protein